MKKIVTIKFIRFENKTQKITIEEAIDLLKADPSHRKYTRDKIKSALERGVKMQLDNSTLQMVGVGYDADPRSKISEIKKERIIKEIKEKHLKPNMGKINKL